MHFLSGKTNQNLIRGSPFVTLNVNRYTSILYNMLNIFDNICVIYSHQPLIFVIIFCFLHKNKVRSVHTKNALKDIHRKTY